MKRIRICDEVGPCWRQDAYYRYHSKYKLIGTHCAYCGADLEPFLEEPLSEKPEATDNANVFN